jgi:Domain of unknown function (DUF5753)
MTDEEIDERVAARLKRLEVLAREQPPALWVIVDEAVLRRSHTARVVGRQLTARDHDIIELRILPRSRGRCRPAGGRLSVCAGAGERDVLQPELATCERPAALPGDGDKP